MICVKFTAFCDLEANLRIRLATLCKSVRKLWFNLQSCVELRQLANPSGHPSQVRTQVLVLQSCVDLRQLANPFGHPSQVRTQVLVLQTCVELLRLASPFGQGFINEKQMFVLVFLIRRSRMHHNCDRLHYT